MKLAPDGRTHAGGAYGSDTQKQPLILFICNRVYACLYCCLNPTPLFCFVVVCGRVFSWSETNVFGNTTGERFITFCNNTNQSNKQLPTSHICFLVPGFFKYSNVSHFHIYFPSLHFINSNFLSLCFFLAIIHFQELLQDIQNLKADPLHRVSESLTQGMLSIIKDKTLPPSQLGLHADISCPLFSLLLTREVGSERYCFYRIPTLLSKIHDLLIKIHDLLIKIH